MVGTGKINMFSRSRLALLLLCVNMTYLFSIFDKGMARTLLYRLAYLFWLDVENFEFAKVHSAFYNSGSGLIFVYKHLPSVLQQGLE